MNTLLDQSDGFDDWAPDQEVEYKLVATVNGEIAGVVKDYDVDAVIAQSNHLEEEVAQLLQSQYTDYLNSED